MKAITLYPFEVRAWQAGKLGLLLRPVKPQDLLKEYAGSFDVGIYNPEIIDKDGFADAGPDTFGIYSKDGDWGIPCPFPPAEYYVQEDWYCIDHENYNEGGLHYKASATSADLEWFIEQGWEWCQPDIMPRWASRGSIRIAEVAVCRLGDLDFDELIQAAHFESKEDWHAVPPYWQEHFGKGFPADSNPYIWKLKIAS